MAVSAQLPTGKQYNSVRLTVLGGASLTRSGSAMTGVASQRRSLALLAVLAVNEGRGISREKLTALLWPDADDESARNRLKQAIHVVRRELGADAVLGVNELRFGSSVVSCDLIDFERCLAAGELEAATAMYAGPFLDGFHAGGD